MATERKDGIVFFFFFVSFLVLGTDLAFFTQP